MLRRDANRHLDRIGKLYLVPVKIAVAISESRQQAARSHQRFA